MTEPRDLIGRRREIERFQGELAAMRGGTCRLVVVRGEGGIGKSALLRTLVEEAEGQGVRVLHGEAHEGERHVPYAAFRHALLAAVDDESGQRLRRTADELATTLRLATRASDPAPGLAATDLCLQLLIDWAERSPVMLVIDDVHAADADTLSLLIFLTRHLRRQRVMIVVASRTSEVDLSLDTASSLAQLSQAVPGTTIDLSPLTTAELHDLIEHRLARAPSPELTERIHHSTAGNPFFILELLRSLGETGHLTDTPAGLELSELGSTLPSSSRAIVLQRVNSLGAVPVHVASVAALLSSLDAGMSSVLMAVCELPRSEVDRAFDLLVRAQVLTAATDGFRFAHPIVRDTLADHLGPARRRTTHRLIADALLERRNDDTASSVVDIAQHLASSAEEGDTGAAAVLVEAGDALRWLAPRSAATWYGRALALLPHDHPRRGEILARLAEANEHAGRPSVAAELAREALTLVNDESTRADLSKTLAISLARAGRGREALAVLDAAEVISGRHQAKLLALRARILIWEERFDLVAQTLDQALRLPGGDRSIPVAIFRHQYYLATGQQPLAEQVEQQLLARSQTLQPRASAAILANLAAMAAYYSNPHQVDALLQRLDKADRSTTWESGAQLAAGLVNLDFELGRWDEALDASDRLLPELVDNGDIALAVMARTVRAVIHAERATPSAEDRAELERSKLFRARVMWALAHLDLADNDLDGARTHLRSALDLERAAGRTSSSSHCLALLAEVELGAGDEGAAARVVAELGALGARTIAPRGEVHRLTATALVCGDVEAGSRAVELASGHGLVYLEALARFAHGKAAHDADLLLDAHSAFKRLGAVRRQQMCTTELRSIGRRLRRRSTTEFSETERRLVKLVADGMTNRQIAGRLHLAHKTVETYLSRLYLKTGCKNRVDLAMAVVEGRFGDLDAEV